jgi:hypothetical protein
VEGTFSLWVGYRAYNYFSHRSQDSYEVIASIPLCKGRSRISDALCDDWVDITKNQIPSKYWKNLEIEPGLRDKRTWIAILHFAQNCVKRDIYEAHKRRETGVIDEGRHIPLPDQVPSDVESFVSLPLSKQYAEEFVRDRI